MNTVRLELTTDGEYVICTGDREHGHEPCDAEGRVTIAYLDRFDPMTMSIEEWQQGFSAGCGNGPHHVSDDDVDRWWGMARASDRYVGDVLARVAKGFT